MLRLIIPAVVISLALASCGAPPDPYADKYEETPWGLAEKDQVEYTTLKDNLVTPVKEIIRILRGKPKVPPEIESPDLAPSKTPDLTA